MNESYMIIRVSEHKGGFLHICKDLSYNETIEELARVFERYCDDIDYYTCDGIMNVLTKHIKFANYASEGEVIQVYKCYNSQLTRIDINEFFEDVAILMHSHYKF